jgi:hypothetical protein
MDQSGPTLRANGVTENKLREGVTTAIGGEGGTPVPAEGIPEYFSTRERQGISLNFGSYFSETQARVTVIGNDNRVPTAKSSLASSDHGAGDAGRREGYDDRLDQSTVKLCADTRAPHDFVVSVHKSIELGLDDSFLMAVGPETLRAVFHVDAGLMLLHSLARKDAMSSFARSQ